MQQLAKWHQRKLGLLTFAAIELVIAYGFASLSIDRGNPWWYLLTLVFLAGTLHNLLRLINKIVHGKK
jgi:hypothetical protein